MLFPMLFSVLPKGFSSTILSPPVTARGWGEGGTDDREELDVDVAEEGLLLAGAAAVMPNRAVETRKNLITSGAVRAIDWN